jgi:glyoxalase family protein
VPNLVKGIHHITVCASGAQDDIDFMTKVVGQRLIKQTVLFDGRYAHYHLYYANANAEVGIGGPAKTVILHHEPAKNQGSWGFGAGTGHHMALEVETDEGLAEQKGLFEELGYTDCSEIKDRNYFHSIYVRSPGGILTECAATAAGGFTRDEAWENLGTSLLLPPWFETQRDTIVRMLEPVTVPEENLPRSSR